MESASRVVSSPLCIVSSPWSFKSMRRSNCPLTSGLSKPFHCCEKRRSIPLSKVPPLVRWFGQYLHLLPHGCLLSGEGLYLLITFGTGEWNVRSYVGRMCSKACRSNYRVLECMGFEPLNCLNVYNLQSKPEYLWAFVVIFSLTKMSPKDVAE